MLRHLLVLLIAFAIVATCVFASRRCAKSDCSDIVGDEFVKDNLGRGHHFAERHHEDLHEQQRLGRIAHKRRGG